jgi:hypothetical protein
MTLRLLRTRGSIVATVRRLLLASEAAEERLPAKRRSVVSSVVPVITAPTALQVSDRKRLASLLLANLETLEVIRNLRRAELDPAIRSSPLRSRAAAPSQTRKRSSA